MAETENTPAAPEITVESVHPEALVVATEAPAEPEAPDAAAEVAAAAEERPAEARKPPKLPEYAEKVIRDYAAEQRETKRQLAEAQAELARLKAAASTSAQPNAADHAAATSNAPAGGYGSKEEFDRAVQAAADARAAQERETAHRKADADAFNAACNDAWAKGSEAFKDDFKTAIANLGQVGFLPVDDGRGGIANRELIDLVLASDNPSQVLFDLGSDPDKAVALISLPPNKRAMEIAKIAAAKAPPAKISNAPAPIRPVEGSARVTGEPRDEDDDATWYAKRNAQVRAKRMGTPA